ncbi:MAG: aspartate carbamoyltransferase [Proteobacteria bacterium]|nr:aspartate carbamoyltransferase [Pseudomonadota bacterium]
MRNKHLNIVRPKHILSASQFDRPFLDYFNQLTTTIRRFDKTKEGLMYLQSLLCHKRAMLYFTQPSTRTFLSFQSASQIVGMKTSEIRDTSTSSERKGETIDDSLRTFSSYVDIIIMRSPVRGLCDHIASILDQTDRPVPIINAGSGPDEHPTQALLDIYTLDRSFKNIGGIEGKTICMVGDLKRGRTVRSLSRLLTLYPGTKILFASPEAFKIEDDLRTMLRTKKVEFIETTEFKDAIASADAIYMTRIQDEYDVSGESKAVDYSNFCLKESHLKILKDHCVIMHPLPRRDELDSKIDNDPRAKYWRQERNGMWTRVALMTVLMDVDRNIMLPEL